MAFTVATFIAFTVLVAVLSWWKTRDDDLSTKEGYFLAGRGLPGIVIAGSLMMTNLSAEQLVGTNGQAFAGNMSTMAWEATSAFALIVLAFVFLPKLLRGGIATIPEFFEMRYDTFTMRLFSLLFLIAYVVTMLPTILYSGAVALVKIFDLESMFGISYFSAITIICIGTGIIGMCYAVFGGLKAVAYSDTINGVGLIIGGFAIPILGIIALGKLDGGGFMAGLDHLISATPEKMNAWSAPNALPPEVPWPLLLTGMFVNNLFYWATNQSIIQRSLGGKNLAESQKGAIWAGFFKCLDVFVIVLPGIIAFQLLAANGQMDTSVGMAADQAYPLLVMKVLPKPLMGFFAAVMFGAILSSFNSVLNSASTIFTLNVWQPIWGKQASNNKVVKVGQIFGTVVGVVSIAIAPFVMFFGTGIMNFINECWGCPVRSAEQKSACYRPEGRYPGPHRAVRSDQGHPVLQPVPLSVRCIRTVRPRVHHLCNLHQGMPASACVGDAGCQGHGYGPMEERQGLGDRLCGSRCNHVSHLFASRHRRINASPRALLPLDSAAVSLRSGAKGSCVL